MCRLGFREGVDGNGFVEASGHAFLAEQDETVHYARILLKAPEADPAGVGKVLEPPFGHKAVANGLCRP